MSASEHLLQNTVDELSVDTPLALWLGEHGISPWEFAKTISADRKSVIGWARGTSIPSLIYAFRIEQATNGGVPAASWLGTKLGMRQWQEFGSIHYGRASKRKKT